MMFDVSNEQAFCELSNAIIGGSLSIAASEGEDVLHGAANVIEGSDTSPTLLAK
jgi:hypothetical protein